MIIKTKTLNKRLFNFKTIIPVLFIGMMFLAFSGSLWAQNLEIHYINVQQGQSTLIIGPDGTTILFDGGNEFKGTDEVVPYLQGLGINTSQPLDYIIASHRDTDHYWGLTEVMNYGYDALTVYDNGSDKYNEFVQDFLDAAAGTTAGGVVPIPLGTVINLGSGATATCVAVDGSVIGSGPVPNGQDNENDRSVCLLIQYGDFDFILTGDVGGGADDYACTGRNTSQVNIETPMVQTIMPGGAYPLLSSYGVEIAHVAHHGSESSGNSDYMNLLTPQLACISVGAGQGSNWFHPRIDVVENVFLAQAPCITAPPAIVLQTEEGNPTGSTTSFAGYCVGDIVITTDGISTYTVSANGAVSQGPDERSAAGLPLTFDLEESGPPDVTPPVISDVHSENVAATTADIVWTTDEPADSLVKYGTSPGSYPNTESDSALAINHRVTLTGLSPTTTYYYIVESTDASNNTSTSSEYSFTTTSGGGGANVVFSEIYYDTIGTDSKEEWIELYNNATSTVDISGWTITDNNGTGATYTIPAGQTMAPGSYFTIAKNSRGFNKLYGYDADLYGDIPALNNDGDTLILKNASGVEQDAVAWEGGASAGIPAGWGSSSLPAASTGESIERTDPAVDTDTYADWSTAPNNGNPQTQGSSPGGSAVVFSEVYYDTIGTDADEEWIELYNNSDSTVDIGGWTITDNNGTGGTYTIAAGETIAAYSYYTLARNSTGFYNLYGYDADLYGLTLALNNDGDTLILEDASSAEQDAVAWEGGASAGTPAGWGSTTLPSASTGSTVVRTDSAVDTDTYADWSTAPNNGNPQTQGGGDVTPPVISNVQAANITAASADIQWNTDEDSDSVVEYGTSPGNYTNSESDPAMVTSHSVTLSNLTPSTTYYYIVKSTDASNNTATSSEYNFTTSAEQQMISTISMTTGTQGKRTYAVATITVTSAGSPVQGAVVDITWTGSAPGTDQGTTDFNGEVVFQSSATKDNPWTFTITIDGITKSGYFWDTGSSETTETISN
jgi:beta-lactamase superfamily II metal-dependent hydrolase